MPEVIISEEVYARVGEFKQVVETVINEEISFEAYVELILGQSINSMLADLLSSAGSTTLLNSLQQLNRKSTRLNSSHIQKSRMPSSA